MKTEYRLDTATGTDKDLIQELMMLVLVLSLTAGLGLRSWYRGDYRSADANGKYAISRHNTQQRIN